MKAGCDEGKRAGSVTISSDTVITLRFLLLLIKKAESPANHDTFFTWKMHQCVRSKTRSRFHFTVTLGLACDH